MEWYYAQDDQRIGPLAQDAFDRLVSQGTVAPETRVWHAGLPEWLPLSQVPPDALQPPPPAPADTAPADTAPADTAPERLRCPRCDGPLTPQEPPAKLRPCPACGAPAIAHAFPALHRRAAAGRDAVAVLLDDDAGCFYHPTKKAEIACDVCGRFLCALCDVDMDDRHLCPGCLSRTRAEIPELEQVRYHFDGMALALAGLPIILLPVVWIFIPFTASTAIFLCIRYWRRSCSIVPRHSRLRFAAALCLALLQLAALGALLILLLTAPRI